MAATALTCAACSACPQLRDARSPPPAADGPLNPNTLYIRTTCYQGPIACKTETRSPTTPATRLYPPPLPSGASRGPAAERAHSTAPSWPSAQSACPSPPRLRPAGRRCSPRSGSCSAWNDMDKRSQRRVCDAGMHGGAGLLTCARRRSCCAPWRPGRAPSGRPAPTPSRAPTSPRPATGSLGS